MADTDCTTRQRLRPWLIAQIDSRNIPGLRWLNDERTKFKIPWKHAGKQDWQPSCSQIFTEWARHTGSYRGDGIDKPQYVKWKMRLRCALHKAPDIDYLEQESQTQEDHPEPYRVYEFKPPRPSGRRKTEISTHCGNVNFCDQLTAGNYLQQHAPLPKMVVEMNEEVIAIGELPADLKHLDSTELRQLNNDGHDGVPINVDSSLTSMSSVTMTSYDDRQVSTTAFDRDLRQVTDSLSSITFDQAAPGSGELANAAATQQPIAVEQAEEDRQLADLLPQASEGRRDVGGMGDAGQLVSSALPTPGVFYTQTATVQSVAASSQFTYTAPAGIAPLNDDANGFEQFGCVHLQDMVISEEFPY